METAYSQALAYILSLTDMERRTDLTGARAHFERALRIFRQFLGEEHPSTVSVRNNLKNLPEG